MEKTNKIDFAPWLQSPYEAECDLELMKSLNTALKINDNAESILNLIEIVDMIEIVKFCFSIS